MSRLSWDQLSNKLYETGIDRGVLYLSNGLAVPWNGLTGVDESFEDDGTSPLYLEGVKYFDFPSMGDYSAKLSALTYPVEFDALDGLFEKLPGFYVDNQPVGLFGLSYRTLIGNDVAGRDYGYQIHILYNLTANATDRDYVSASSSPDLTDFSWDISGVPAQFTTYSGYAPTSHVIADSRLMDTELLHDLENILYGSNSVDATLPSLQNLGQFLEFLIDITDNGDGSWTATGPDAYVKTFGDGTFQIDHANFTMLDAVTYSLTDTPS